MTNKNQFKIGEQIVWGNPNYVENNGVVRAISRDGMTLYIRQTFPPSHAKLIDVLVTQARRPAPSSDNPDAG